MSRPATLGEMRARYGPRYRWLLLLSVMLGTMASIKGRIGLGFILPSLNLGSLRALDPNLISQGSSAINFVRMLGGAIGVSLCGMVLEWRRSVHGDSLAQAATSPARLAAFNEAFLMLAALCALALVAVWKIRSPTQQTTLTGGD